MKKVGVAFLKRKALLDCQATRLVQDQQEITLLTERSALITVIKEQIGKAATTTTAAASSSSTGLDEQISSGEKDQKGKEGKKYNYICCIAQTKCNAVSKED